MARASSLVQALVVASALSAGCVRAPTPLDVAALVREHGAAGARGELEVRILDSPRDVQARLALARLADEAGRPTQALVQLDAVNALGGPLGTRWHAEDRARFVRLLVARGRARLARGSRTALADLQRAKRDGAAVTDLELARATAAVAIAKLHHIDGKERDAGQRMLAALASQPFAPVEWAGAAAQTTPRARGEFGAWLWRSGARRAAWELLSQWRATTTERDLDTNDIHATYLRAYAWWTPPAAEATVTDPTFPQDLPDPGGGDPVVRFVRARGVGAAWLGEMVAGYRRDPAIADRMARDRIAEAVDAAHVRAELGVMFGALGDPARARQQWQAAVDESPRGATDETDAWIVAGLAEAVARAGDPDAALVHATAAAAAMGDPAQVWIVIARALEDVGSHAHALEAAHAALDLAGRDTIADAYDAAIAPSRGMGRLAQATAFTLRRDQARAGSDGRDDGAVVEAIASVERNPNGATIAMLWVASRAQPRDVASRRALMGAMGPDDPRRAMLVDELVALAGDRDANVGRGALAALR